MRLTDDQWLFVLRASPPNSLLEHAAQDVLEARQMHRVTLDHKAEQMRREITERFDGRTTPTERL